MNETIKSVFWMLSSHLTEGKNTFKTKEAKISKLTKAKGKKVFLPSVSSLNELGELVSRKTFLIKQSLYYRFAVTKVIPQPFYYTHESKKSRQHSHKFIPISNKAHFVCVYDELLSANKCQNG